MTAAPAIGQSRPDLPAVGVVFHGGGVHLGVKEHGSVRRHPGEPVGLAAELTEIVLPHQLRGSDGEGQLLPELPLLHPGKVFKHTSGDDHQTGQQHHQGHQHGGTKDFSGHSAASSR